MTRYLVRNTMTGEEITMYSLERARELALELEEKTRILWAVVREQVDEFEGIDIFKRIEWAEKQLQEIINACDNNRPCMIIGKPMTKEEEKEWADKFFDEF